MEPEQSLGINAEQLAASLLQMRATQTEGTDIPFQDPTLLDWEETIIPELRRFFFKTNAPHYEIEEWVRRIRAQMMLGNEKALLFVAKDVLGPGIALPRNIMPFFPPHLRQRSYIRYHRPQEEAGLLTSEVLTHYPESVLMNTPTNNAPRSTGYKRSYSSAQRRTGAHQNAESRRCRLCGWPFCQ